MIEFFKGKSGYYGVTPTRSRNYHRWRVQVVHRGKHFFLGEYKDVRVAAIAADVLLRTLRPDSKRLNRVLFPEFKTVEALYDSLGEDTLDDFVRLIKSHRRLLKRLSLPIPTRS